MIHVDTIEDVANEQVELWTNGSIHGNKERIDAYFQNLGVCPDCVNLSAQLISHSPITGDPDEPEIAFLRGFVIGILLGRTHPA